MLETLRVSMFAPALVSFAFFSMAGCVKTDTETMHESEASTNVVGTDSGSSEAGPSSSAGSTMSVSSTSSSSEHGESTATSHHGTTGDGGEASSATDVDPSLDDGTEHSSSTGEGLGCLDIHDEPTCEAEPYCEWLPQGQGPQGHCIWDCFAIEDEAVCEASRQCVWGGQMCMYPI